MTAQGAPSSHEDSGVIRHPKGTVIGDKYRLEGELARGGMGSVWVAEHLQLECRVAVKFIDPELGLSESARKRFEREAKLAAGLRSPHVVHIYDHGVDQDTPYIVMELLEGEDLGARLKREGRMPLPALAAIVDQLSKGLQVAHAAGIVHRDLKPSNVFLVASEDGDLVKLLDFGVAKVQSSAITDEATKTGQILGSPHYMSPEQAKGAKTIDHRSDLWSLGVMVYRAITGRRPFAGETFGELIVAICTAPMAAPSSLVPDLPPGVDAFFERALARDPALRFQSAREMAAAFAEVVTGTTDAPTPEPRSPRRELVSHATVELSTSDLLPVTATVSNTSEPSVDRRAHTLTLPGAPQSFPSLSAEAIVPRRRRALVWVGVGCGVLMTIAGALALVDQTAAAPLAVASPPPTQPATASATPAEPAASTEAPAAVAPAPSARPQPVRTGNRAAPPPLPRPPSPPPPHRTPSPVPKGTDPYNDR
jgi:serine/threonine-protein kinase